MRKLRFKCVGKMMLMMMHMGLAKSSTTFCPEPEIIRVSHATHWMMPFPPGFCGNPSISSDSITDIMYLRVIVSSLVFFYNNSVTWEFF